MPSILITTNHLEKLQGSEIVTLELAELLLEKGWQVDVFTHLLGGEIKLSFESLPNQERLFITDDNEFEFSMDYDYIWIQHNVINSYFLKRLFEVGVTAKFIFNHMSSFAHMEMPLSAEFESIIATKVLTVSEESRNVLIEKGIQKDKIIILDNPSPSRFCNDIRVNRTRIEKIAIVSNHPPKEIFEVKDLFLLQGIQCDLIGASGKSLRITPEILSEYDVVITIGKTVQYALVGGIPVYIYDIYGGEGYLNKSNFSISSSFNFSGRATKRSRNAPEIVSEILEGYEEAREFVLSRRVEFIKRWDAGVRIPEILSQLEDSRYVKFDEETKELFTIHNKILRQSNVPKWSYDKWSQARTCKKHKLEAIKTILNYSGYTPSVEVIVIARSDSDALKKTIESAQEQHYAAERISVVTESKIAEEFTHEINIYHCDKWEEALAKITSSSSQDVIMVIFEGDVLLPNALLKLVEKKFSQSNSLFYYFDEENGKDGGGLEPQLKPDINIDLLRSYPYVGRVLAFDRKIVSDFTSLDCTKGEFIVTDLLLKVIEKFGTNCIAHIDDVSVRTCHPLINFLNEKNIHVYTGIINEHLQRLSIKAEVFSVNNGKSIRVKYLIDFNPKVSLIIPTRNNYVALSRCIESLTENTAYGNYEILIADNASDDINTVDFIQGVKNLELERIRVMQLDFTENSAELCNKAVDEAEADFVLFLSDDCEFSDRHWLEELLSLALRPEVGLVGPKVINEKAQIQHAGIILGLNGSVGKAFQGHSSVTEGYMNRLTVAQNVSALAISCLMVAKKNFISVGGFSHKQFAQNFAEVDLALKLSAEGFIHVWTPFSVLYQRSNAKSNLINKENRVRSYDIDTFNLRSKWLVELANDGAYHKSLSRSSPGYEITPYMALVSDPLPGRPLPVILANNLDRQGCGYYRVLHPFKALDEQLYIDGGTNDTLFNLPEISRINPDVILVQPGLRRGLSQYFKEIRGSSSAKIILDYDDYLPNIPVSSVARRRAKQDIIKDIRRDCEQADWVVVSTLPLAEEFSKFTTKIKIAENGLPVEAWAHLKTRRRTRSKLRVGWAGGGSHTGDLSIIKPMIKALQNEVEWVFMGMKPHGIECEYHAAVPINLYPEKLSSLNLDLALVPLEVNQFNVCKSNLRLLELGACGVPIICTDIEPFRCNLPVTLVRNKFNDWIEAIKSHVYEKEALSRKGDELRDAIHQNWMLREELLDKWNVAWTKF